MSETRGGDDWWMASDGKWYPPTSVPEPPRPPRPPMSPAELPAESTPTTARKGPGCLPVFGVVAVLVVLVSLLISALGGNDDEPDASAKLACREFRSTAPAQADGHLLPSELRDRLKKVNDYAWVSDEPDIAPAASALLAAATAGVLTAAEVNRMGRACEAIGL